MSFILRPLAALGAAFVTASACAQSAAPATSPIPVTADNFVRAESDTMFAAMVKRNGLGRFGHNRDLAPVEAQTVVRVNRDTLYSTAVSISTPAP
jgi:hypothetical protein